MSELAFDANGEPITFPANAEELRVRRFRNPGMRGACEVVHDQDGAPLYVPIDIGYLELRNEVDGIPARYRLDPVDATRRPIANAVPAYVTVTDVRRSQGSSGLAHDRNDSVMNVVGELARANAEMAKTMADRFSSVMQAAADLLRAADGAGLPRREAAPPPPENVIDEDNDEDEDDEDDEDDMGGPPEIAALVSQLLPMLQMWLASRTSAKSVTTAPPVTPVSAATSMPASEPSGGAAATPNAVPHAPVASPLEWAGQAGEAAMASIPEPAPQPGIPPATVSGSPTDAVRNAARTESGQRAHLMAIYAHLLPVEKRVAELVIGRMAPERRSQWLLEVSAMTVDEAVALLRSLIAEVHRRREAGETTAPAASPSLSGAPSKPLPAEPDAGARSGGAIMSGAPMVHLMAIYARLSPPERRIAELVATRMPPDVQAQWLGALSARSVDEAVEYVRSMIPAFQGTSATAARVDRGHPDSSAESRG